MGVILKDINGDGVMAASKLEHEVQDPETAKLLAMFYGI